MSIAYGIIALISLCMVGVCVLADKKRDIWLLLVFVSVSLCNLGYFMTAISKDLNDALNSNRISYLGSVFLPFFMLMMVLRFCEIKLNKKASISLFILGIIMLTITNSPSILPIYYSKVDIEIVNGSTKLLREYGPLHLLYYVYLIGYMISMIVITLYAITKKKIKSKYHTFLILCTVFCNILIWLVEQFLPRGFEWLSVSYIITECLILAIYHSMPKEGLFNLYEKKQSYTINVLLSVFLLLFASFIRVATKETTEILHITSQIIILLIYVGILVSWGISVYDRIVNKNIRRYMITLVVLMVLWMLLRTLRHTVFYYVFPVGQWCWYAYYIAMVLIPQICLYAAKYIGKPEDYRLKKKWKLMYIPSIILIIIILTNDLHQWAFRFHLGYEIGWDIYQRKIMYYVVVIWIFVCIALMIIEIIKNCHIPGTKKMIWFPLIMLAICLLYSIMYAVDTNLFGFIEITAALCFTMVSVWESSIKTGLIQSNSHYDELMRSSELGVAVVDDEYKIYYSSENALLLSQEQMEQVVKNPIILNGGIRVSASKIPGGYTMWQEDVSEIFDIIDELKVLREELKDANEVSMQNYQMDKKIRTLAEKNRLHDEIHRQTSHQIDLLNDWLKKLIEVNDMKEKRKLLRHIVVVGAYLKRRNNLILVSEQDGIIKEEEFELSINEMMKNLQLSGINCASSIQFGCDVPSDTAMKLIDFYEYIVEEAFDGLEYLLARFFKRDDGFYCCVDVMCSLDLTTLQTKDILVDASEENYYTLSFKIEGRSC